MQGQASLPCPLRVVSRYGVPIHKRRPWQAVEESRGGQKVIPYPLQRKCPRGIYPACGRTRLRCTSQITVTPSGYDRTPAVIYLPRPRRRCLFNVLMPFAVFAISSMVVLQNGPMKSWRLAAGRSNKLRHGVSHRRASSYLPASLCTVLVGRPRIATSLGVPSCSEMLSFGAASIVDGPSVKPCVRPVATPFRMDCNVVPLVLCG